MDTIKQTIKFYFWGTRGVVKKQIERVKQTFDEDETLIGVCMRYDKPNDQLFVTNKRVIGIKITSPFTTDEQEIYNSDIKSFSVKQNNMLHSRVTVSSFNDRITCDKVPNNIAQGMRQTLSSIKNSA